MTREARAVALFNLLPSVGYVTRSRRLKHWADVDGSQQPALFLARGNEAPTQVPGLPTVWRETYSVYIYAFDGADDAVPSTALNDLLDALETAMNTGLVGGKQTLGGTVQHAWISGAIETDEGTLGAQAVAIIPIEILTA